MLSNPNSIRYACVSEGTTIVAEFNSENADLAALAAKCLEKVPQNHEIFSHTVKGKTYTFLIDDVHVYFAIYIHTLEKSEGVAFLRKVKEAYKEIEAAENVDDDHLKKVSSHCFQGVFSPIFHRLLASTEQIEPPVTPRDRVRHSRSGSLDSLGKGIGSMSLLGGDYSSLLKKKRRMSMDVTGKGIADKKVDVSDDSVILHKNIGLLADPGQKAKKVWKKHVWVVLSMDLIICSILFGVWLWICRGLQCMDQSL